jgi:phosphoglycerol transferase MdoB-like AlkP superfamily enzyme
MNHDKMHSPKLTARLRIAAGLAFVWLLAILALSGAEWIANFHNIAPAQNKITLLLLKLAEDLIIWLKTYLLILAVYLATSYLSLRFAAGLSIVLLLMLVLVQGMLATYFSRALLPLGADLYGYSLKEIIQTTGASGGVPIGMALLFLAFLTALGLLFRMALRRARVRTWLAVLLLLLSLLAWMVPAAHYRLRKKFDTDFDANLVSNKLSFFASRSWDHFFPSLPETDIYSDSYAAEDETASGSLPFIYPDQTAFPFYHTDNYQDVLSPFFAPPDSSLHSRPPSIVIILVEGLGRAFTNDGAYLGNFTPFVDSLSHHSLYWKNFLSEGGRTFAVLPSLLGSLPFGKNGFLAMAEGMPRQLSLIDILRANGYHSSFYYGGDAHFDNMDIFLRNGGVDEINDERSFPAGSARLPAISGFSWGYNDGAVFRHDLETRPEKGPSPRSPRAPQLSIILTVSTHSPFAINEQAKYAALFEARMSVLGMNEEEKTAHRAFKDQFASILYADDALRGFFSAYSKRADYANTIFIITGDHRMPEIPMRTKIDRYHVPLIIFSPLLKRTAEFQSISTHFDLLPSLIAFLTARYGLQRPPDVPWIGSGLDTARQFRNIHAYALMQTKTDLLDFIDGEYHLNGSTLFRLSPDLNEVPVPDDPRKQVLENVFNRFLRLNDRVVPGSKLVPDSSLLFFRK